MSALEPGDRDALHRVLRARRDVRTGFVDTPVDDERLHRVLEAAHTAPSVGFSQPWDFVVMRAPALRDELAALAQQQRQEFAASLPAARARQFAGLKIEAILETPVNIVVTCDPTRGGRHILGRHTQPRMAAYSVAGAVENLWLAARAEGLGVGWVSFFDEREMVRRCTSARAARAPRGRRLPVRRVRRRVRRRARARHAGWARRRPLSWVVHADTWGNRAMDPLDETLAALADLDTAEGEAAARERLTRMTKPPGALGDVGELGVRLSGLAGTCPPPIPEPAVVAIFAGDHGVHAQGVTPWPQEVTAQMVANFLAGGAAVNAFAATVGAEVAVVDVGVAADLDPAPGLLPRKVRHGTADMTAGPAMTRDEARAAMEVGIETARDLVDGGQPAAGHRRHGHRQHHRVGGAGRRVHRAPPPSRSPAAAPASTTRPTPARSTSSPRPWTSTARTPPTRSACSPPSAASSTRRSPGSCWAPRRCARRSSSTAWCRRGGARGGRAGPDCVTACIAGHRSVEPAHTLALEHLGLRPRSTWTCGSARAPARCSRCRW